MQTMNIDYETEAAFAPPITPVEPVGQSEGFRSLLEEAEQPTREVQPGPQSRTHLNPGPVTGN